MGVVITTSWDDGHASDLRVAQMLAKRGMRGTFYWTVDHRQFANPGPTETRDLLDMGMEIGAHTMTHPDLTATSDEELRWELTESKRRVEDLIERTVSSFCYPFGRFDRRVRDAVAVAGYEVARTTESFSTSRGRHPLLMPVTGHLYPHGARTHIAHTVRRGNLIGLIHWLTRYRMTTDIEAIIYRALDHVADSGGVVHLWGHSWEADDLELWPALERILDLLASRPEVHYATNHEVVCSARGTQTT